MEVTFDIQLKPKDLFRFNMYQTYTTTQGPISIILAILVFVMAGVSFYKGDMSYGVMYGVGGVFFLVYIPVSLWLRARHTLAGNAVLSGVLHYTIGDEGIRVTQGEDSGVLPWDQIYKIVGTQKQVLIYSNRVNAYIIPREQLGDKYGSMAELAGTKLEKYRVRMK